MHAHTFDKFEVSDWIFAFPFCKSTLHFTDTEQKAFLDGAIDFLKDNEHYMDENHKLESFSDALELFKRITRDLTASIADILGKKNGFTVKLAEPQSFLLALFDPSCVYDFKGALKNVLQAVEKFIEACTNISAKEKKRILNLFPGELKIQNLTEAPPKFFISPWGVENIFLARFYDVFYPKKAKDNDFLLVQMHNRLNDLKDIPPHHPIPTVEYTHKLCNLTLQEWTREHFENAFLLLNYNRIEHFYSIFKPRIEVLQDSKVVLERYFNGAQCASLDSMTSDLIVQMHNILEYCRKSTGTKLNEEAIREWKRAISSVPGATWQLKLFILLCILALVCCAIGWQLLLHKRHMNESARV